MAQVTRPIQLSFVPVAGGDFRCDEAEGANSSAACQVACDDQDCRDGYRACVLLHLECRHVFVNSEHQWATLKTNASSAVDVGVSTSMSHAGFGRPIRHAVTSEDAWVLAMREALRTGEGVLSAAQMGRAWRRPGGFFGGAGRRGRHHGGLMPHGFG